MIVSKCYSTKRAEDYSGRQGNYTHICAYCGKEMQEYTDMECRETYYHCDCADAQKEHEISKQIEELNRQYPHPKYYIGIEYVLKEIK